MEERMFVSHQLAGGNIRITDYDGKLGIFLPSTP